MFIPSNDADGIADIVDYGLKDHYGMIYHKTTVDERKTQVTFYVLFQT